MIVTVTNLQNRMWTIRLRVTKGLKGKLMKMTVRSVEHVFFINYDSLITLVRVVYLFKMYSLLFICFYVQILATVQSVARFGECDQTLSWLNVVCINALST